MTEDVNGNANVKDESLLLVSGSKGSKGSDKDYVKKLSNAILQVFTKHSTVNMRCVGAASLNNAIKSFIIAKGEAQKSGNKLAISPSFTTVSFNSEEKTGIVLEVVTIDD
jgi:stage V sporulation protein SpoVS